MDSVARHLAANHGIISRSEALKLDMTERQITYRVKAGVWTRLEPSVFRLAGSPTTWRGNVRATTLSVDGLASHGTAATLHRIDGWDQRRIEVVVAWERRPKQRPRVIIHRSTQMALADACEVDGIATTGLARTVLDIAGTVGAKRLEWTIDAVLRSGRLDWPDLYAVLVRHAAKGRNGCGPLRALLDRRYGDKVVPDSKFNRLVGQLLEDAGITGFVFEHEILQRGKFLARADIAFPTKQLAIECDSKRWHLNGHSFEHDRKRQNRVTLSGWTVLQFTWDTYIESPASIVDDVYTALKMKLGA